MTNLDIIKYLALNNPSRLAELLDDLYCNAWNCGNYAQVHIAEEKFSPYEMEFSESKWLEQEANTDFFFEEELEEWSKASTKMVRNCLNCAHLGDPFIWCDACDDFEYWEAEK